MMQGTITVNSQDVPIGNLILISPVYQKEHDFQVNSDYSTRNHQISARFLFNHELFSNPVNSTQAQFNQALRCRQPQARPRRCLESKLTPGERSASLIFVLSPNFQNPCDSCPPDVTIWELEPVTVGPGDNQFSKQNTYQILDALSWVRGKHTFKFGGQIRPLHRAAVLPF